MHRPSVGILALAFVGLVGCGQNAARRGRVPPAGEGIDAARAAPLAAAAESVFVVIARPRPADGVLLATDAATARALDLPSRRAGLTVRVSADTAWCASGVSKASTPRLVGTGVRMGVDSLTANRAVVSWAATCLHESPSHPAPFAGGEAGSFEVVRKGGAWRVVRTLLSMSL